MFKVFGSTLLATLLISLVTGCQTTSQVKKAINTADIPPQKISEADTQGSAKSEPLNLLSAYDYQLYNSKWQPTSLTSIFEDLKEVDVIFIGEYHGNHASHLLQTQFIAQLYQQHPELVLSLEMFNRDHQTIVNNYLDGFIGEQTLINDAPAWPNYKASYRPSVEFAKEHFLPVVAANAAADIVRCIGAQGESYFGKLDENEKTNIAQQPFATVEGYEEKFTGFMGASNHASESRMRNSYFAQLTRDNTMAESILQAIKSNPKHKVIHLNGTFHSENHLGTVGALKRMAPELTIKVITPIYLDQLNEAKVDSTRTDDYYYTLNPQPAEYVKNENRRKAHQRMFDNARKKAKACK